jgi:DNA-binding MarR family transcriptional regulator
MTIHAETRDGLIDGIADNILNFQPLLYKKLMHGGQANPGKRASYLEAPILCMLVNHDPMPISEIGRRLYISKPNMTPLVNKLIKEGKAQRIPDAEDRRVINIAVTPGGRRFMKDHRVLVKEGIKHNLKRISLDDLRRLCSSLEQVRNIVSKINDQE